MAAEIVTIRPWMKQPGEVFDANGIPVYPGDLIRTYHFTGPRRKRYYLYHTAVYKDGAMSLVPVSHLEPSCVRGSDGVCLLLQELMADAEIIHGYGPLPFLYYDERPRSI